MAPERAGTLVVLNLDFQEKVLVSKTQFLGAGTEEGPDTRNKLYVDWNSIQRPQGYLSVAEGAAFVREATISVNSHKEEQLTRTSNGSYIWENAVETAWILLIIVLPIAYRLDSLYPTPRRMRAKVFNDRLVLIVWADAPNDSYFPAETNKIYFRAEIRIAQIEPNLDLQSEAERINSKVNENVPVIRDVVVPQFRSDLCVVTALAEPEFTALLEIPWEWRRRGDEPEDPDTDYWEGFYTAGNRRREVIAACSMRMGMPAAAVLATKMIYLFAPRYLAMVGILAGIRHKCSLGDVIAVDPSWDWGSGKWSEKDGVIGFEPDPHQLDPDVSIQRKLKRMRQDGGEVLDGIRRGWEKRTGQKVDSTLNMHIGPVASGASVLSDDHHVDLVQEQHRKAIGIEMEAYAVFVAAREARSLQPKAFVFKSVVDFADKEKRDDHQAYAAYTSAWALKHFAETYLNG